MTALISAELMEATWQHVGASSAARILALQKECGKHQQELSGFVIEYTAALSPEAIGLALYAYVVIFQAFRHNGAVLRKIRDARILRQWEVTGQVIAELRTTGKRLESMPSVECSEPTVLAYIADALSEDQEDAVPLTDEEYWHIVRVLLTATECLHQGAQKAT